LFSFQLHQSFKMATSARASVVINASIEKVWAIIRSFTFPATLISTIESVEMLEGAAPTTVGASRKLKWKSGEIQTQRLLELSDIERRAVWETTESEPDHEVSAAISTLQAHRITENNSTLLTWTAEFSADVKGDFITFQQRALQENWGEIKAQFF